MECTENVEQRNQCFDLTPRNPTKRKLKIEVLYCALFTSELYFVGAQMSNFSHKMLMCITNFKPIFQVIDMSTVLEVITVLEGTTITKEQLETTRLAKYINQLRRKTSNDQLARRSKNLLKKWREMVIPNTVQLQSTTNAPLSHPSSAISPNSVSNQSSNRLAGITSLSNGGTPTTQHQPTSVPPDLVDATQIGKSIKAPIQVQLQQKPPRVKSIFDLDFDDVDDPIHRYTSDKDNIKVELVENAVKFNDPSNYNSMPSSLQDSKGCNTENSTTTAFSVCLPPPPIPVNEPTICQCFEVVEDALCPAKAHFITNKNLVTQYHVDMLHNCFIPNVNGNWSVIESEGTKSESTDSHKLEELKFVPKYNHMRLDKIPKNMRDFDMGWCRQRKLRKKVEKTEAVDSQPPNCGNVDQDETEVISSRLSNSSQANVIDQVTHSDGRDELNCDLKTSCMDDGNVEDVSRVNELETMDGQSEECIASIDSRKRKGSKRKIVKYKIRKSSSDFSRDLDGAGGPYDGDGVDPKIEAPPTRIILKFSRQVTTDADVEDGEDDDDDDYDESDEDEDDGEETFDECEEEDEIMEDVEDESFVHDKDDLLEYIDQSNCHSNDNIREINIVENNNDDNEKFVRNVDCTEVMDVDHVKLHRFNTDEHDSRPASIKFDDHLSSSSFHRTPTLPISQLPVHSELLQSHANELNRNDSNQIDIATTPQLMDYDDNDNDKTGEQLPLENNEQLASFNNISNENESGIRPTLGQEFKEWHEVVRVRSYNDELLTILPYVVID